jgi:hypothetical protein
VRPATGRTPDHEGAARRGSGRVSHGIRRVRADWTRIAGEATAEGGG